MTTRISYAQRVRIFGVAGNRKNTVIVRTPWGIDAVCHRVVAERFMVACDEAAVRSPWRPLRVDSFAYRPIRNALSLSFHSWALAWDFFSTPPGVPPPGGVWHPDDAVPPDFAAAFTGRGFTWGATFSRRADYPHIEWAAGLPSVPPPTGPGPGPYRPEVEMFLYRQSNTKEIKLYEGKGRIRAGLTETIATDLLTVLDQRPGGPGTDRKEWVLSKETVAWLEGSA